MSKADALRKALDKSNIVTGTNDPDQWLSTGIHSLNFDMTGTFDKGIPNRRSVLFWGESGTGKSWIVTNLAKDAQDKGYFIIYIDTEHALHTDFLEKVGVDTSEDKFLAINVSTIGDTTKTVSNILKAYDPEDKVFVIIDSVSNLETESDSDNFDKGIAKGDQGQLAKQLKKMVKSFNAKMGNRDMFLVCAGQAYQNQNMLNGEGLWIFSGGKGFQFIPSISVLLTKKKLKDDDKEVIGVKIGTEITKSRFAKLGGKSVIELDYEKGYDPWAGMLEMGLKAGLIKQAAAWYNYTIDGELVKFQRKNFGDHYKKVFNMIDSAEPAESEEYEEVEA